MHQDWHEIDWTTRNITMFELEWLVGSSCFIHDNVLCQAPISQTWLVPIDIKPTAVDRLFSAYVSQTPVVHRPVNEDFGTHIQSRPADHRKC